MIASRFFIHSVPVPPIPVLSRYALIVVDAQSRYVNTPWAEQAIARINQIAPQFEAAGALTYWVYNHGIDSHSIDNSAKNNGGYAANYKSNSVNFIWPKNGYSSFIEKFFFGGSKLHAHLQERCVTDLFLCGLNFSCCEFFTAREGYALGYNTHVLLDASANNQANMPETENTFRRYRMEFPGIKLIDSEEGLNLVKGRLYTPPALLYAMP